MGLFSKVIGGAIGWSMGGPIGAIIGVSIASAFGDKKKTNTLFQNRQNNNIDDFENSLLILATYIVKADNKVYRSEMNFVKEFLINLYGKTRAEISYKIFEQIMKKNNINIRQVALQISQFTTHATRLQLIHFLFGIALADGNVCAEELDAIKLISGYFRISEKDYESIKAMFYSDSTSAYTILEIKKNATDAEVKKAYRALAKKHHPDKVLHMGEEYAKAAKEKFQAIQNAFDIISKERGI